MNGDEKFRIERGTAEAFLRVYNEHFRTTFGIRKHCDSPDIRCEDDAGSELNLENTVTSDADGDIQALLGRSNHKNFGSVSADVSCAGSDPDCVAFDAVKERLICRIEEKLTKDYGTNVALVIRDTSGLYWDWSEVAGELERKLAPKRDTFDRGIWVLARTGDRLFRIVPAVE